MEAVLEDNGLKEFIDKDIPKPQHRMLMIWPNGESVWKR